MSETDQNIVKRLKENDEAALKEVIRLYFNQLLFFATEFVINKEVAQEIVQDAILKFWQHRLRLNDDTRIKAYLLKVVRNLSLDYLSKIKNNPEFLLSPEELKHELALNQEILSETGWDKLLVLELEELISQAIASLPEKCRHVFELSRYQQLSNHEIANQLHISVKTVEGHMTDALKTIRYKMDKYLKMIVLISIP
jgi:RNA polymerase sigma-70 factor, ECF subfamily